MSEGHQITLETLAGGALKERFEHELARALANIANPDTPATAARDITVKVRIKPQEDREIGLITATVTSKLPPLLSAVTQAFFGTKDGVLMAVEPDARQPALFDQGKGKARAKHLNLVGGD